MEKWDFIFHSHFTWKQFSYFFEAQKLKIRSSLKKSQTDNFSTYKICQNWFHVKIWGRKIHIFPHCDFWSTFNEKEDDTFSIKVTKHDVGIVVPARWCRCWYIILVLKKINGRTVIILTAALRRGCVGFSHKSTVDVRCHFWGHLSKRQFFMNWKHVFLY